ncbi:protein-L-isoaspartate O-methyltransferase [Kitasatospora sp. MAP12-15]|uniref:hypothetical protein n=1 Tax=unclassified Kitasatospora TaxID=2633591 RepID=UPI00247316CF|nr:hypothetical protein [Kitasatospora sp. MAP12-44]MDH6115523.1 protein-L-isoaspartate O-methyltransferase [Kitasatospora sp. MAP12-44]
MAERLGYLYAPIERGQLSVTVERPRLGNVNGRDESTRPRGPGDAVGWLAAGEFMRTDPASAGQVGLPPFSAVDVPQWPMAGRAADQFHSRKRWLFRDRSRPFHGEDLAYAAERLWRRSGGDPTDPHQDYAPVPPVRVHGDAIEVLRAADLKAGLRVMEIGTAGDGRTACIMAAVTGTTVLTVDVDGSTSYRARAAVDCAGLRRLVSVQQQDGYLARSNEPLDRIITTCAIAGVPPAWIGQLAPGGYIVGPIGFRGLEILARITTGPRGLRARPIAAARRAVAVGLLHPGRHLDDLPVPPFTHDRCGTVPDDLSHDAYYDLWMYLATQDRRTTKVPISDESGNGCALVTRDRSHAVRVLRGALLLSDHNPRTHEMADRLTRLIADWDTLGRPTIDRWTATLLRAGRPGAQLLALAHWELG